MIGLLLFFCMQTGGDVAAQAMRDGRFADAERAYEAMLAANPQDARLHMNLALAQYSSGKYAEAVRHFDVFLKANPAPGPAHLMAGVSRLKLGKHCDAVPILEKARLWKADAQVLVELGDAYFGCGRFSDAAKTFEQLGRTPKGLQGAGLSYARMGLEQKSKDAFAALTAMPESAELHELLAEVRTIEQRFDDAATEMEAALRLAPGDSRLTRLHARTLWRAGKYDAARAKYEELKPKWSHDAQFNYEFGDTLSRLEGPEAGVDLLRAAAKAMPSLTPARGALGRVLVQLGKHAEAIKHLESAAGQDDTLLLPLSRAYRAVGRAEEGQRAETEYRTRVGER